MSAQGCCFSFRRKRICRADLGVPAFAPRTAGTLEHDKLGRMRVGAYRNKSTSKQYNGES
jgi:hypothetical protein